MECKNPMQHEALLTAQLSMLILGIWSQGVPAEPSSLAESLAAVPPVANGLRAHQVSELWGAGLTVAKFTARVAGLAIPKGAHTQ